MSKLILWYDSAKREGQFLKDGKVITFKDVTHSEFCELLEKHTKTVEGN